MKKIVLGLCLSLGLALPTLAQTPSDGISDRDYAMAAMAHTPLVTMERDAALLVARQSFRCAHYFEFVLNLGVSASKGRELPPDVKQAMQSIEAAIGYHLLIGILIHDIYSIDEETERTILHEEAVKFENHVRQSESEMVALRNQYDDVCVALVATYMPRIPGMPRM